jgi:hypothetical protein
MENFIQSKPLELTSTSVGYLSETRKWTLFISILGFIFMGFCIILIPFILATSGVGGRRVSGLMTPLPIILMTVLYFFPIYYLLRFSINSKKAILESDGHLLEIAFKYLKLHYRFMGMLVIFGIVIYSIAGLAVAVTYFFN